MWSGPLLATVLAQAIEATATVSPPTVVVVPVTPAPAMDPFTFVLALLDRPAVTSLIAAVAAVLIWLTKRDQGKSEKRLEQVHDQLNGRLTDMIEAQTGRAHAEGKLEGHAEAATAPPPPPVIVVPPVVPPVVQPPRDPQARTRASDRPPPESDPSSHQ